MGGREGGVWEVEGGERVTIWQRAKEIPNARPHGSTFFTRLAAFTVSHVDLQKDSQSNVWEQCIQVFDARKHLTEGAPVVCRSAFVKEVCSSKVCDEWPHCLFVRMRVSSV